MAHPVCPVYYDFKREQVRMDGPEYPAKSQGELFTLEVSPRQGEVIKPAELIDLRGTQRLTLQDRRIYNQLLANAFGPDMATEGRVFNIQLSELRGNMASSERVLESIHRLRHTDVVAKCDDGELLTVTLLGAVKHPPLGRGIATRLQYSFDPALLPVLRDSHIFARLELRLLMDFSTKYGLALYEMVARRAKLKHKFYEVFSIDDFREFLGVPDGKLTAYADMRRKAIEPAVAEVNALAPFSCDVMVESTEGRRVTHLRLSWWIKSVDERKAQWAQQNQAHSQLLDFRDEFVSFEEDE